MKKEIGLCLFIIFIALVGLSVIFVDFKSTGFAVLNDYVTEADCVTAGYTWENITNETCIDIPNCTECVTENCNETCQICGDVEVGQCNNLTYITQEDCEAANYSWQNTTVESCTNISDCIFIFPFTGVYLIALISRLSITFLIFL